MRARLAAVLRFYSWRKLALSILLPLLSFLDVVPASAREQLTYWIVRPCLDFLAIALCSSFPAPQEVHNHGEGTASAER
jgi:hypothetical protein